MVDDKPPNLTQTENRAWDWLTTERGYSPSDIQRAGPKQTPDYICPDESFEVKRVYETSDGLPRVVTYDSQVSKLDDEDPIILVFHENESEPRMTFRWSDRSAAGVEVKVRSDKVVKVSTRTYKDLEQIKEELGLNSFDAALREAILRSSLHRITDGNGEADQDTIKAK